MEPSPLPTFVSRQVVEAKRSFLDLNPDGASALQLVCVGVERARPDYIIDRVDFPYFAIELVAEGVGTLKLDGRSYELSSGTAFAYGPKTPHTIRNQSVQGMRKYYLDFVGIRGQLLLQQADLLAEDGQYEIASVSALHEVTDLFDMLIREASRTGPLVPSLCGVLVEALLIKLRQNRQPLRSKISKSLQTFEMVRSYIDQHFLELETVRQVAAECGLSPVYLSRLFSNFSEQGALQYLNRQKMNYAAGLLMNEGLLVKDVAAKLGFVDPFQFSRTFKRVYGVPPGQLTSPIE